MTDLTPNDLCLQGEHAPGPEPLSPAAEAVLDAALPHQVHRYAAAAALRELADQVVPDIDEPEWGACNEMHCDIELFTDHQRKRADTLAIATELEGK